MEQVNGIEAASIPVLFSSMKKEEDRRIESSDHPEAGRENERRDSDAGRCAFAASGPSR